MKLAYWDEKYMIWDWLVRYKIYLEWSRWKWYIFVEFINNSINKYDIFYITKAEWWNIKKISWYVWDFKPKYFEINTN